MINTNNLNVYIGSCITYSETSCTKGRPRSQILDSQNNGETASEPTNNYDLDTRLIPDMRFNCSGTLVGWTVSGRAGNGTLFPKLQIWRRSDSEPFVYHKNGPEIQIDAEGSACESISQMCNQTFRCKLQQSYHVTLRAGLDIIGIELPHSDNQGFEMYFIPIPVPIPIDLTSSDISNSAWKQLVWKGEVNSSSLTIDIDIEMYQMIQEIVDFNKPLISIDVLSGKYKV